MNLRQTARAAIPLAVAASAFLLSAPAGLSPPAWRLFGIFLGTIAALMTQVLPEPSVLLLALTCAACFAVPLKEVMAGFTDNTLWLIVLAIFMSVGFKKSGLTGRVGLWMLGRFGRTSLGLGYVLGFMDLLLATSTPAAPARGGGIVYPLAEGVLGACGASDRSCPRKLGAYLTILCYMMCMTTGVIFMTGLGPNLYNAKLAREMLGIEVDWSLWAVAALPVFVGFLITPWLVYKLYPPEIESLEYIADSVRAKRRALGPLSRDEKLAGGVFLLVVGLWATGTLTRLDATLVALIGLSLMLVLRLVAWKDLAEAKEAWSILIWFGAILGLSAGLSSQGFFTWFAGFLKATLPTHGLSQLAGLGIVALLAVLPHYFFASFVGYVAAFAPLIFSFVAATEVPRYPAFFLVAFLMGISSILTHYGNGLGPLLMAKGYNDKKSWWAIGLMLTAMHVALCLTLGLAWWKLIGLW